MTRLAVATREETYERMRGPLGDRGIDVGFVEVEERVLPLRERPAEFRGFDVGYVYPSRLMEGAVVAGHLGVPWVNDRDAVLRSRNKAGVLARLDRADVPIPDSVLVSNPADDAVRRSAFEAIGPPVVVKPNSTTRGVGVARADDLDSFLGVTDYVELLHEFPATRDRSFLVQEFLPDARDYRVMVVDGEYAGAVERRHDDSGRWKHNVHRDATAQGVDLEPTLRAVAERAASVVGIPVLGVDLLVSGDRVVVTETNARPTIDAPEKYESDFYDRLAGVIEQRAERPA